VTRRQLQTAEQCAVQVERGGSLLQEQPGLSLETGQSSRSVERLLPASPSASPSAVLALIERVALDPRADAEKLERVMAMYERLQAKEAEFAYNAAKGRILKKLARVKIVKTRSALCEIASGKRQKSGYEAFKYAPLEEIDKHLRPLLAEEEMDLSYSDEPQQGGGLLIRGRLKHLPSGHYEDSFMPAPPDTSGGKSDVQAVGSTNSFLRRYVACNIFNIVVVGDDDDGSGGTIDEVQTRTILDLVKKVKAGSKFLKYMKAQSIEEAGSLDAAVATIAARDYRKAISTLEQQIAKAEAGRADLS
jgi:ERF superfamily